MSLRDRVIQKMADRMYAAFEAERAAIIEERGEDMKERRHNDYRSLIDNYSEDGVAAFEQEYWAGTFDTEAKQAMSAIQRRLSREQNNA